MAQPIHCDNHRGTMAVYLVGEIDTGRQHALCAACLGTFKVPETENNAGVLIDKVSETVPYRDPALDTPAPVVPDLQAVAQVLAGDPTDEQLQDEVLATLGALGLEANGKAQCPDCGFVTPTPTWFEAIVCPRCGVDYHVEPTEPAPVPTAVEMELAKVNADAEAEDKASEPVSIKRPPKPKPKAAPKTAAGGSDD